jgi:hypothetical protein
MTLARARSALGITKGVSPAAGMWRFCPDDPHGEQAAAASVAAKVTSGMMTNDPDDLYDAEVIDTLDGSDLSGNPALQKAQRLCTTSHPEAWLYSSAALSIGGTDVRTKLIDITRASLLQGLLDETEMRDEELQPWVDTACDWLLLGLCEFTLGHALTPVEPVDWFQAVLYLFSTVDIKLSDHEECCEHSIKCTGYTLNQFRSSSLVYLFATVWHCFNVNPVETVLQLMEGHLDGAGNWRPCPDTDADTPVADNSLEMIESAQMQPESKKHEDRQWQRWHVHRLAVGCLAPSECHSDELYWSAHGRLAQRTECVCLVLGSTQPARPADTATPVMREHANVRRQCAQVHNPPEPRGSGAGAGERDRSNQPRGERLRHLSQCGARYD